MTRYYFHADNGSPIADEEGEELSGLDAARDVARAVMAEMLAIRHYSVWDAGSLSVTVKDEAGRMVARLTTAATTEPDVLASVHTKP